MVDLLHTTLLPLLALGTAALRNNDTRDICSSADTGFLGTEHAIACYAGTFLVKMLDELNAGPPLGPRKR